MSRPKAATTKTQPGNSKEASAERRIAFANAYIANGRNGKRAAIEVGYSEASAESQASRILRDPAVREIVDAAMEKASAASGLTVERTLAELARIAYAEIGHEFENGTKLSAAEKIAALDKAMKHLGQYEKDNRQLGDNIRVIVELV